MRTVKITAKTVDEAVAEGLRQLGVTRDQAIVHVEEEPNGGLFGLLRKKQAVVSVSAPDVVTPGDIAKEAARVVSEAFSDVKPSASEKQEEEPAAQEEEKAEPAEEKAEEPASEADQEEEPVEEDLSEEKPEEAEEEEKPEEDKKPAHSRRDDFVFNKEEQDETAAAARKFLEDVFQAMDMKVIIETMTNEERILLTLHGDRMGILIGKHGQTLDALQYLTNLAAGRLYHHHYFVMLDVEGYRERRRQTLESLARRCADKARRTGQPVKLEPMPAGERKIIHLALQQEADIDTESEGEVPQRAVVIRLKK
jgi:spoIIIJ-associated protein